MPTDCISYQQSGYFTKLITDYLAQKPELKALYNRFPSLENFSLQLAEKEQNFNSKDNRKTLVSALEKQYQTFDISEVTQKNISLLADSKTFTITTGHQLNLFTGPLYFLYKIVSTINLCKELKEAYPDYNFVPIYWMASEDHDFEEINYFHFKQTKIKWNRESNGPVGRLSTAGLDEVFEVFTRELGLGHNATYLQSLFDNSYLKHATLADATRYLANELFGKYGLVILDGDDAILKQLFVPYVEKELLDQSAFEKVMKTNKSLLDYTIQVNPREINLFYIEDAIRERIVLEDNVYKVNHTDLVFTKAEILSLLKNHPEKFSPNVILRPLYQEVILPNLCYVGGGGEIAYWLQLKSNFEANAVSFPILLVRNSAVLVTQKQWQKADKLGLSWADLFNNQQDLFNQKTKELSQFKLDFTPQKEYLKQQFAALHDVALQTDKSFGKAVKAQEVKQLKGLENLEKRLLKAEKRQHADTLERIIQLQNEIFPNQSLQERRNNFSEFYLDYGDELIAVIFEKLRPLDTDFMTICL
ncbi:bacillithiol biosynthesis cysteine-adding enzyme BshC [Flavobacterium sp.]|jgi:bacillithiol biosynthesis cysteine-adding enzyme BshC|uniref:bacillithiol biosynthesis cysteine-adding enzyme BshC n=1 Tax=Flavobacterium sp. TaxID=239 RepID=UPI0037C03412